MTVNGKDIAEFGATLLSADYGYSTITNYKDWLRGAHQPLFYEQTITYTKATYKIIVESDELDKKCSDLVAAMAKSLVRVSDCDWSLDGTVNNVSDSNRIAPTAREIEVEMEGIKVADRETLTHEFTIGKEWEFEAKGNTDVPCVIEISPDMGYVNLDLTLNGTLYRTKNISSTDILLIIDSENGIITLDGDNKIEDYDAWELPYIKGGTNTMSFASGAPTVKIKYNGRWM